MNTTTSTLHIRWDDGALAASADHAPVLIGRGMDAAVQINDRAVSRAHVRVHTDGEGWVALDESSRGTFDSAGGQVERVSIRDGEVTLHLGSPDGPEVRLVAVAPPVEQVPVLPASEPDVASPQPSPQPTPPPHAPPPPIGGAQPQGVPAASPPQAPYVPPIDTGEAWTVATFDTTLRLEVDGQKHAFSPPGRVVVGRDQGCDVVCDNDLVSRQHVAFTSSGEGAEWMMEDLGSSRGTFVDGRKLTKPTPAQGAFVAVLGDDEAGERLQIVTAGVHTKPKDRSKWIPALAVLVLGAIISVGVAWALRPDDDTAERQAAALDLAKKASVQIIAELDGEPMWTGSGSLISEDGLILTNAHVADPTAPGQPDAEEVEELLELAGMSLDDVVYLIATTEADDTPSEAAYRAETIVSDGVLDVAVMKLTETIDGDAIDPAVLPEPMPIGDSTALQTGDTLIALGYPGITDSDLGETPESSLTVTRGVVSTFKDDPYSGVDRSWIDSDLRLASGNSGGASINEDGEVVGINSAVVNKEILDLIGASGSFALIRPAEVAGEVLEIARAGGDPGYESPHLDNVPERTEETEPSEPPEDLSEAEVSPAGWSASRQVDSECSGADTLDGVSPGDNVFALFQVTGVPAGTPVTLIGEVVETGATDGPYLASWPGEDDCVSGGLLVPAVSDMNSVTLVATIIFGGDNEIVVDNQVTINF